MALKNESIEDVTRKRFQTSDLRQKKTNMTQHNFRMDQQDWDILKAHFEDKGVSIAGGVRWVLRDYMTENGLR